LDLGLRTSGIGLINILKLNAEKTEMIKERQNSTRGKPEILIVEDSFTQATQIKHLLESNQYKVSVTQNGIQAMDWLSNHRPFLVISDIIMPEMTGYELCKKIKSDKDTEDIPVILLTRLSDPEEIIEGLSCGADSFITKPYNEKHLLSNIGKLLSEGNDDTYKKVPFGVQILFNREKRTIQAEQQNVIKLMLNIYEGAIYQNEKLIQTREELKLLNDQLESIVEQRTSDLREEMNLSNQIADKLKESEVKWRTLVTNIPDYIALHDREAKFLFLNHYADGFSEMDTMGKSLLDFLSNESKDIYKKNFKKCLRNGQIQKFEYTAYGNNKEVRTYESSLIPIKQSRKVTNVMAIARDITERKQTEEKIRIMASFPSENPDPILRVDRHGKLLYANEASYKLLTWKLHIGEKVPSSLLKTVIDTIKEGNAKEIDTEHDKRIYSFKIVPVAEGSYANIYCRDITIHKQDEKEIHELNTQLERRVIERTSQLEEANKELEAFTYSVSHDLRAPLRAVDGFSKIVQEDYGGKLDSEGKRIIDLIRSGTRKMDQLITDLLALSHINKNELNFSAIDMTQMAISVFAETVQDDIKDNIRFTVDQLPEAYADPAFLKQIWINLISNAIKFSSKKKNPEITICGKTVNNISTYFIKDNGVGFNQKYAYKLFGVFQRLHSSDDFEGTGIGLVIVKRIINRHGGKVWAEGKQGKGATFFFSLPEKEQDKR
jgi:PAS domain S-box-containing protein